MSLEGVMSSMGKSRDIDGSVDRIPPPPEEMWAILYAIQRKCEDENINLEGAMEEGGGNHYGMMKLTQFKSTLKTNLPRFHITEDTFERILGCKTKHIDMKLMFIVLAMHQAKTGNAFPIGGGFEIAITQAGRS